MLALYEKLSELGYANLRQFYSIDDQAPIENGTHLIKQFHATAPDDIRWNLYIENHFFS